MCQVSTVQLEEGGRTLLDSRIHPGPGPPEDTSTTGKSLIRCWEDWCPVEYCPVAAEGPDVFHPVLQNTVLKPVLDAPCSRRGADPERHACPAFRKPFIQLIQRG